MLIKKKYINDKLEQEFGKEASDVYNFYWKQGVKQSILDLRHLEIFIPELGSFNIIKKKIPNMEIAVKRLAENFEPKKHLLDKMEIIKGLYEERLNIKNEKRRLRNEYLEKQVEDTRGDLV